MAEMSSAIATRMNLNEIGYSMLWEDEQVLRAALELDSGDQVLSMTSAGCNVLALLLDEPAGITAIDFSPSQNEILRLKLAAIRHFDHDQFLNLLGFRNNLDPIALLTRLVPALPASSRQFWLTHRHLLQEGLIHQGRLEHYLCGLGDGLRQFWSPADFAKLWNSRHVGEQVRIWQELCTPPVRTMIHDFFAVQNQRSGRDHSKFAHVVADVPGDLSRRLDSCMERFLIRHNHYLEYQLYGRIRHPEKSYAYLHPGNFTRLKGLVDRVRIVTGELEKHMEAVDAGFYTKANLSDVFEYMSEESAGNLFRRIGERFTTGGRIAYWNLYVPRNSGGSTSGLSINQRLSRRLQSKDRVYFYDRLMVEDVTGPEEA